MNLKTIPETLFIRKIDKEALKYSPNDETYCIQFDFKNKRHTIRDYKSNTNRWSPPLLEEEKISNSPTSGFVLVWPDRVRDPRGFEAMISNLNEIISTSVINRGVIEEDMWYAVDSGNHLALVSPETEKDIKNTISSVTELKVGDIVEKGYGSSHFGLYRSHGIYLGKMKIRERKYDDPYMAGTASLTTSRVVYNIETDDFDKWGWFLEAGAVLSGKADDDTVTEAINRFKSHLVAYTHLDDKIDEIFAPEGSEKDYPSDMFDVLCSVDRKQSSDIRYPFYRIIGPKTIECLTLRPDYEHSWSSFKDGIRFQIDKKDLTDYGEFMDKMNCAKIEESLVKLPNTWKEILEAQGWIYYGSIDHPWKSNPDLMVRMKSGLTFNI